MQETKQTTAEQFEFQFAEPLNGAQYRVRRAGERKSLIGETVTAATGSSAWSFGGQKQLEARVGQQWFRAYSWAYAAIERIARDVAALPFVIRKAGDPEGDPITTGPLFELLAHPNTLKTITRMRKRLLLHTLAAGNAFWLLDSGNPQFKGQAREIWPLQPEAMRPVPDPDKVIIGWNYDPGFSGSTFLPREAVIHHSIEDPQDLIMGMSIFEPMAPAVQSSLAAMKWNLNFFENDATPSSVSIEVPEVLSDANYKRLKEQISESHTGVKHAFEPLLLEGGATINPFQHSHKEMGFENLLRLDREQAMAVTGVPPAVAGDWREMNFAQSEAQLLLYWMSTCTPISRDMCDTLNTFLVPVVQPGVAISQDFSSVSVLQPDKAAELKLDGDRIRSGLATPNQILEERGRDTYPEGDQYYVTGDLVRVEDVGVKQAGPAAFSVGDGKLEEKALEIEKAMQNVEQRTAWQEYHRRLGKWERKIQRAWQDEIKRVIKFVERKLRQPGAAPKMTTGERKLTGGDEPPRVMLPMDSSFYMPNGDDLNADITTRLRLIHLDMVEEFGELAAREISSAAVFDVGSPNVLEIVSRVEDQIGSATFNLLGDLKPMLDGGLTEGESIGSLVNRIREKMEGQGGVARAERIARTESGAAANSAKFEGYRQLGVEQTEWVAVLDQFTRDSHDHLHGTRANVGEPFGNGLMFPLDPGGPPEEIVNCRCTARAVPIEAAEAA